MSWQANSILLVGPIPPPFGGMSLQTLAFKKWLKREGYSVSLLATNPPLKPHFLNRLRGVRGLIRLMVLVAALCRQVRKVDVIHLMANSGLSWFVFAMPTLIIAKIFKVPVVLNYRGGNAQAFLNRHPKTIKPILNLARCIVVPSDFLAQIFKKYGYRVQIIPNCVDTHRFKPREKQDTFFHCLVARNLEPIYGIDIAIKAFAKAYQKHPQLRLSIAGSGPQLQMLKKLVHQLELEEVIDFLGRLNRVQMAKAFSKAHLLINPSRVDNMPNALLEAQASGVPILSTDVGGIPYMVEHMKTAVLVPNENIELMSQMISKLVEDKVLREFLIEQGLESIRHHSWEVMIKTWSKVYEHAGGSIA